MPTISIFYGILIRRFFREGARPMRIVNVHTQSDRCLSVRAEDGRVGSFDVKPYLGYEAFEPLKIQEEFARVSTGGYFVEWDCGADLSADTIEAHWQVTGQVPVGATA